MNKAVWTGVVLVVVALVIIAGYFGYMKSQLAAPTTKPPINGTAQHPGTAKPATGEPIQLGASFPMTGDNASYGQDAQSGIQIALDEINAAGGCGGKPIAVVFEDDKVDAKLGVANMEKFASVLKVPAVLGSAGSGVTLAMAPVANRTSTVLISPISSAAAVTDAGDYVFRTCPSDMAQAEDISRWFTEKGYKSVGVLYITNAWGEGLKDNFVKAFTAGGGAVPLVEGAAEQATDFRASLTKFKSAGLDALYMPTYSKQGGRILKQVLNLGITTPIYGGDTWGAQELFDAAGNAADGAYFVVPDKHDGPEYQAFSAKYQAKYNKVPDFNACSSYDCMHVVAVAMNAVVAGGAPLTGPSLKDALYKATYSGATGVTKFNANGDVVGKAFGRRIIKGGQAVPVEN